MGHRRDADEGFHLAARDKDTDERQPMAIWDSINQVYFEDRESTAGCSVWENKLRGSRRLISSYRGRQFIH